MNITKESLEQEIDYYKRMIQQYQNNPEYVNPNCSLQQAYSILDKLIKESYIYGNNFRKRS